MNNTVILERYFRITNYEQNDIIRLTSWGFIPGQN